MLRSNTPVENHNGLWVKREDLCSENPGPPFSKFRGVVAHLAQRMEPVIGVLDTAHSKAGWAVAAACKELGKKCVNYWPRYQREKEGIIRPHQQRSKELGAELVELKAGRSAILYHRARKLLKDTGQWSYMMPNALKLEESVEETAREVDITPACRVCQDIIISISSGTIAAGVLRGLARNQAFPRVHIHMGYSRSHNAVTSYLQEYAPHFPQELLTLIDEGYGYADAAKGSAPFPCNAYYDLKAWNWAQKKDWEDANVLFWNIGD